MTIKIKVIAQAKQNRILQNGGDFKIWVTATPEKGKANAKVIKLLAREFKVAQSQIEIIKGLTSRDKIVRINKEI